MNELLFTTYSVHMAKNGHFLAGKFKFLKIAGFLIEFTCIYHAQACEPVGSHPGYPIPPHEIRNPNNPGGDANSRRRKHGRDSPRASF